MFSIIQAAGWPIWSLIACSIFALAIIIERFYSLRTSRIAPADLLDEVLSVTRSGIPSREVIQQLEKSSLMGEVLATALNTLQTTPNCSDDDLRANVESAGKKVAHRLEHYLNALGTIASAAPLLGLFGTVIGMIEIFGSQAPAGAANPAQLAHGISVALYNTAFGLVVAVPSLIFWRYFRGVVDAYILSLELASDRLVRQLLARRSH